MIMVEDETVVYLTVDCVLLIRAKLPGIIDANRARKFATLNFLLLQNQK
jgi:hypothetical protein